MKIRSKKAILVIFLCLAICICSIVIAFNILKNNVENKNQTEQTLGDIPKDVPNDVVALPCTHEYGPWRVTRESTCTEKGCRTRTCRLCEENTETEELPLLPHEYISVGEISDCDGTVLYRVEICLNCMDIHGLEDAPDVIHPHEFERRAPVDPTCTSLGVEVWFECRKCGYDVTKLIPELGHLPGSVAYDDPDNHKYHYHVCQRVDCGVRLYDESHTYSWQIATQETCTTSGVAEGICSQCGHVYENTISARHLWGEWFLTESNPDNPCEHKRECYRCDAEQYKTEHNFSEFVLSNSNPDNACEHVKECSRCGEKEYETVHLESEWVPTNNPEEPCEFAKICPRCHIEWEKAIMHDWGDPVLTNNPDEPCEHKVECTRCGEEMDKIIIHDWIEWAVDPSHPCSFHWECRRCGATKDLTKHQETPPIHIPATCTQNGYVLSICGRCHLLIDEIITPALGHDEEYEYDDNMHHLRCQRTECRQRLSEYEDHILTVVLKQKYSEGCYFYSLKYVCYTCGYEKLLAENLLHVHDGAELIEKIPPTCTEIGYDYGLKCSVPGCEEILVEPCELPPLGHHYVEHVCVRCGDILPSDGLEYTLSEDETYYILSKLGACIDTRVYIADEYGGLPVKEIAPEVFQFAEHITYVYIPDTITTIGESAFWNCTNLESIILPDSITHIGNESFTYCESLTEISIPQGVECISEGLFLNCYKLAQIELPDGLRVIEPYAFSGCASLVSITLPSSVETIGDDAFFGCWKLVEIINHSALPLSLSNDFWDYGCITGHAREIHRGESRIENYNDYLFCTYDDVHYLLGYVGDDTDLVLPENYDGYTYHIIGYAFWGRTDLTSVVVGNGVTEIHYGAFSGCTSLKSVVFGDSIERIDSQAFYRCSGLTELVIPKNITRIYHDAFVGCTGLTKIVVDGENLKYHSAGNCLIETKNKTLILGCRDSVIPSDGSVTVIASEAFYQNEFLTSITIPNDIIDIGASAFEKCKNLKQVIFEENSCLTRIDMYAFWDCESLTSIFIPASVTYINSQAFGFVQDKSNNLASIVVDEENTKYHSNGNCLIETATKTLMFASNNSVIPSDGTVTKIANGAFKGCKQLISIQIPDTVTHIGNSAFSGCENLMSVTLGSSVETIGESAFYGCYRLVEVINLSSCSIFCGSYDYGGIARYAIEVHSEAGRLSDVDGYMFYRGIEKNYLVGYVGEAYALILPSFSDGTTYEIYQYAFQHCDHIVSITIPENVTKIGENAFEYCYRLVEVIHHRAPESFDIIGQGYLSNYALEIHAGASKIVEYQDFLFYTYNGTHYLIDYLGEESHLVLPESYYGETYVIHRYAFNALQNPVSVVIPDSVERIDDSSFGNCSNLQSVVIGAGVKTVNAGAFVNSSKLGSVVFKNTEAWLMNTILIPSEIMGNDELMAKLMIYFNNYTWHS